MPKGKGTRFTMGRWVSGLLGAAFLTASMAAPSQAPLPLDPVNDNVNTTQIAQPVQASARVTQTLRLENGLEVLLTSDPAADRSAAALSVGTGSLYDPAEKNGMDHYLEHMLFLGTEKYPDVSSYDKFIQSNGGESNAYTSSSYTNFYFEIRPASFAEALDRFSSFFKAPLFDPHYASREIKAVDSEFNDHKQEDNWRAAYLQNGTAKPGHPVSYFSIGNEETLAGDNREILLAIFNKYYSASNMKLAIISNLSLKEQESLVREKFSAIPGFKVEKPFIDPAFREPLHNQYRLLQIEPVEDIRNLSLEFPTIRFSDYQESNPQIIVNALINHEGKNSLLSRLKQEGLVLGLSAGSLSLHPNINTMNIGINLTRKGLEHYEQVMEMVFSYLNLLKTQGVKEHTFKEEQAIRQHNLDWRSPAQGSGYVSQYASLMQSYKLEDVETLPYLIKKFDPAGYKAVLQTMTPENMLVTLSAKSVKTDKTEHFYGTHYSLKTVGGPQFDRLAHPHQTQGMMYPEPNKFIPDSLTLIDEKPHLVINSPQAQIWSQHDNRFKQPKAYLSLRLETPLVSNTAGNNMRAALLQWCIAEGMNEQAYSLEKAGLSSTIEFSNLGMTISLGGYTNRINDLARLVSKNLTTCKISEKKFADMKEYLQRGLANSKMASALDQASYSLNMMLNSRKFSEEEKAQALRTITLNDVKHYAKNILASTDVTGMAYGNWNDEEVKDAVNLLLKATGGKPLPQTKPAAHKAPLDKGERIVFSKQVADNNNALLYILNAGDKKPVRLAALRVLNASIKEDFYTQMRTNQQLGYTVYSQIEERNNRLSLHFSIQSPRYGPVELQKRVEAWMKDALQSFDTMSDNDFRTFADGVAESYKLKTESVRDEHTRLFQIVTTEAGDFDVQKKMFEALKNLKKSDLKSLATELLGSADTPRIIVHIRAKDNHEPAPAGAMTDVQQFRHRHRPVKMPIIPSPSPDAVAASSPSPALR